MGGRRWSWWRREDGGSGGQDGQRRLCGVWCCPRGLGSCSAVAVGQHSRAMRSTVGGDGGRGRKRGEGDTGEEWRERKTEGKKWREAGLDNDCILTYHLVCVLSCAVTHSLSHTLSIHVPLRQETGVTINSLSSSTLPSLLFLVCCRSGHPLLHCGREGGCAHLVCGTTEVYRAMERGSNSS